MAAGVVALCLLTLVLQTQWQLWVLAWLLVSMIALATFLQSAFAHWLGCVILQAVVLVPATVCEACSDVRVRYASA